MSEQQPENEELTGQQEEAPAEADTTTADAEADGAVDGEGVVEEDGAQGGGGDGSE